MRAQETIFGRSVLLPALFGESGPLRSLAAEDFAGQLQVADLQAQPAAIGGRKRRIDARRDIGMIDDRHQPIGGCRKRRKPAGASEDASAEFADAAPASDNA